MTLCLLSLVLCSCSGLSYYHQSITGQWRLMQAKEEIHSILDDPSVSATLKRRLSSITRIRDFASEELGLPDNDSYRSYADIGRRYVVWNVFATPALSLEPHQSCFPIIGCLNYRGYFDRADALAYGKTLEKKGFDVYVGGVTAYSTLGWFGDPVLNGMLERSDEELARLIFHELAHQRLYLKDDTDFNEAFAEAVAQIGMVKWLQRHTDSRAKSAYYEDLAREEAFHQLVLSYREKLAALYNSQAAPGKKRVEKQRILAALKADYKILRNSWGNIADYDNWMSGVNNARISAVATYQLLVPDFLAIFESLGSRLDLFLRHMDHIAECSAGSRRSMLRRQIISTECRIADEAARAANWNREIPVNPGL